MFLPIQFSFYPPRTEIQEASAYGNGWLTGWDYRTPIEIDNNTEDLTNYQVQITLQGTNPAGANYVDFGKVLANGADIRFTDSNKTTEIDFWIEQWVDTPSSESATIWLEVPSILTAGIKTVYVYYGKTGVSSGSSGDNTFEFFDDFDGGEIVDITDLNFNAIGDDGVALSNGASGSWDFRIRGELANIIYDHGNSIGGNYIMVYSGYAGAYTQGECKVGLAYSTDGKEWVKYTNNPVISNWTEDLYLVKNGSTYYLYGEDAPNANVILYTSTNLIDWAYQGIVLAPEGGWEGSEIGSSVVWIEGNTWYMLYEGLGASGCIGLATSSNGTSWTKEATNPVFENTDTSWASGAISPGDIYKNDSTYYLLYDGYPGYGNFKVGLATSTNLISWVDSSNSPIIDTSSAMLCGGIDYLVYNPIGGGAGARIDKAYLYEEGDWSRWNKVDPNDRFSIVQGKLAIKNLSREEDAYVYANISAINNFAIDFDFTSIDTTNSRFLIGLGNEIGMLGGIDDAVGLFNHRSILYGWQRHDGNSNLTSQTSHSDIKYYFTITKYGSLVTINVFTDSARSVHKSGSPKTYDGGYDDSYIYAYAISSSNTGNSCPGDADIYCYRLRKYTSTEPTAATTSAYRGYDKIFTGITNTISATDYVSYSAEPSVGNLVDMTIAPASGSIDTSITTWNTSGTYYKKWTETGDGNTGNTAHTIGDLKTNTYYLVKVDGIIFNTYLSNSSGEISFTYTGGYSSHEFEVEDNSPGHSGGSLPQDAYSPPAIPNSSDDNPQGGFNIIINNGSEATNNQTVALKLFGGVDARKMVMSENPDFKNTIQESYQETKQWSLSYGDGIKTIYVKFYTKYGVGSEIVSDSIVLDTGLKKEIKQDKSEMPIGNEPVEKTSLSEKDKSTNLIITQNLKYGSNNNQVINLQNKLKQLNLFPKEIKSNGNFGPATKNAVKEFQKSVGIYPCGIVGPRTRKALNNQEFITNKDYQFTKDLKYNDKEEEVKQLQTRLRDQSFFPYYIKSTGWFGPITQKAVKLFQKFHNMIENGIVGELVRGRLNL